MTANNKNRNESWLNQFIGRRKISKTLRFELRPIGKTLDNIKKDGLLQKDEERASDYVDLKALIDRYHKSFIERALANCRIDWTELEKSLDKKKDATDEKNLFEDKAKIYRGKIAKLFTDGENNVIYKKMFEKELFSELLPSFLQANNGSKDEFDLVKKFAQFTTYLTGFHENRKNIYSKEREVTAIGYRVVHENFLKFANNIKAYNEIAKRAPQIIEKVKEELSAELKKKSVMMEDIFTLKFFNDVVTQKGIEFYNQILGGLSRKAGEKKTRGLNEFINLHNQKNKNDRLPRFVPLYKQILSDRDTASFRPEPFESDKELINALISFCANKLMMGTSESPLQKLEKTLEELDMFNPEKMRVRKNDLATISQDLFGYWNRILEIRTELCEKEKEKRACEKKTVFTIKELNDALTVKDLELKREGENGLKSTSIFPYWDMKEAKTKIFESYKDLGELFSAEDSDVNLSEERIKRIKTFLDDVLNFYRKVEMLFNAEPEEGQFLGEISEPLDLLSDIVPLYNKTRNYVTRKPGDKLEKYKLTFENPKLGTGWSKGVEASKGCVIFIRNGNYYLGVLNNKDKPDIDSLPRTDEPDAFRKMVYQQVTDPTRDIPNLMVIDGKTKRKTGRKDSNNVNKILEELKNKYLPENVNQIRKSGTFRSNSPDFRKEDLTVYIDYYMRRISEYKSELSYDFKKPAEYTSWDEFLGDIKKQSYKITFEPIAEKDLMKLVEEGKLFLFQIYSKDFSSHSYGRPNLHTLYWKSVFSPENLADTVVKLSGRAELFYRKGNNETKVTHRKGSILLNRQTKDGRTIPAEIYCKISDALNGKKSESELTEEAQKWKQNAVVKTAEHDIVKGKRFTQPKFHFHVSLEINFQSPEDDPTINEDILQILRAPRQKFAVLGIDRGERNLIYITLIDQDGKILLQKSLNQVEYTRSDGITNPYDYQAKLDQREKERDKNRKSWKSIGTIKELKEGYISQVVHEIAKYVAKYNAVIVMEDLNFGFKRGRFHVEKQVYQKFEKALLDKFNYLVFKDRDALEPGGVLKGYQLTKKFESFRNLQNQSGVIFYVPAAYTSKIDPATGFTNPLGHLRYESVVKSQNTIKESIASARYNSEEGYFEFDLPYTKNEGSKKGLKKKTWTVCTHGDLRWAWKVNKNNKGETVAVNVTEELKNHFTKYGISYESGGDLKQAILDQIEKGFFSTLFYLLNLTLQLRYSNNNTENEKDRDFILSPVKDKNGKFFDSRKADETMPKDADANGAYHIALKGLFHIKSGESKLTRKGFDQKWIDDRRQSLK